MRLFAALRPPAPVRDALLGIARGPVSGARWQDEGQLHLTLGFFGEVAERDAEGLHDALSQVPFGAFDLRLHGVGLLERHAGGALYAAVVRSDPLIRLAAAAAQAARRAGIALERRAFLPHVTLARGVRRGEGARHWLEAHHDFTAPPWQVRDFRLYASTLHPSGARYDEIARYSASSDARS